MTNLHSSQQAAKLLGICVSTLYDWLTQSDAGLFEIRGQRVSVNYFQGGRKGQGRIKLEQSEIKRLLDLMRVTPNTKVQRTKPSRKTSFQYISSKPGRPDD